RKLLLRHDHTARDDQLHGCIHAHIQLDDLAAGYDNQEPGRGIERIGYIDTTMLRTGLTADLRDVLRRHEPQAPDPCPRVLDHHDLAEGVRLRKNAFRKALYAAVDAADHGDPIQQLLRERHQLAPDQIRDQEPR